MKRVLSLAFAAVTLGVGMANAKDPTFADDVAFLKKHTNAIVLKGEGGGAVVVIPQYQCRVMTSATDAAGGEGFGFINYNLIKSGKLLPHMNGFGGEDRFWMGPEGGQYAIFFKDRSEFDLAHWQTPAPIDSDKYKVIAQTPTSVTCAHTFNLVNYSGSKFKVNVTRRVEIQSPKLAMDALGLDSLDGVKTVAFRTVNTVKNVGNTNWDELSGKLSIWILGMYKPSNETTIVAPYNTNGTGPIVKDMYFGKVPADRLKVDGDLILFRGDGKMRTKIGLPPSRAKDVIGAYDAARNLLTIVKFTFEPNATDYVNSMWELQDKPFGGDVTNSYNDGPASPGAKPFGPFYEIETSSRALGLQQHESHTHVSQTFHFTGPREALDAISKKVLGAELDHVAATFK